MCCKSNKDIFQIIHNFLKNPFFQINEFMCPADMSLNEGQIRLDTIGVINTEFVIVEHPLCQKGVLGLSKKSTFL